MIAREAVLNDPEVARMLAERFIPIGLDNVDHPNLTPGERQFLKDKGLNSSTQGMSAFTAGGTVLAMGGGFQAEPVRRMLTEALAKFDPNAEPATAAALDESVIDPDAKPILRPPVGGLVLYVTWKVLGGLERPQSSATTGDGHYDKEFQRSLGVDRLWVRADEAAALATGELPPSLARRMARHVTYVMSGKVTEQDLSLDNGRLTGTFATDTGERPHAGGFIEATDGKVRRFQVLVQGLGERKEDCGFAAGLTIVPKGTKAPVGLLFELADPADDLSQVVPHRALDQTYLE